MEQWALGLTIVLVYIVSPIKNVLHHSSPGWLRTVKVYSEQVLPIFEDVVEAFRAKVVEVLQRVVLDRLLQVCPNLFVLRVWGLVHFFT